MRLLNGTADMGYTVRTKRFEPIPHGFTLLLCVNTNGYVIYHRVVKTRRSPVLGSFIEGVVLPLPSPWLNIGPFFYYFVF